ncbi:hypothetical protein ABZ235_28280 [Streptomyces canus]|uniref:hypothetical protein n=1 Tax=Streptomyces canus TaxID=58343 RepID=UPI0033BD6266
MKLVLDRDELAAAAMTAVGHSEVALERLDVRPAYKASHGFVNNASADVCELAAVTLLQATCFGKPVILLPVTTLGRFQHQTLVTCRGLSVDDIEGRTVGIRSWSQTTGVWVRGFLAEQYGVDLRKVKWVVYEGGHIDGYTDPPWVQRASSPASLQADFLNGRLDYGIMGNELPVDDRIRPAIANAANAATEWAQRNGFAPINHVLGVNVAAARDHSAEICLMYDAMRRVTEAQSAELSIDMHPVGFDALRGPINQVAAYAVEQGILPEYVEFDDLVARSCAALGVLPSRLGG